MKTQRIALCLGHARPGDSGAAAADCQTTERKFNRAVIERLTGVLRSDGVEVIPVLEYRGSTYATAMLWLSRYLKDKEATAAIEFHFNAANGSAEGHEFLHWAQSLRGKTLATDMLLAFDAAFPKETSRGLKPISFSGRGAAFLQYTHCPACIAEPFFGDNPRQWSLFNSPAGMARLVSAYAAGIKNWIASQA